MALTYDTTSNGGAASSVTSETFSHTVGTGSNRILMVFVTSEDSTATDRDVTGVTYNAVAMTRCDTPRVEGNCESEWWYLVSPDEGAHDVVITWTGTVTSGGGIAISYFGAKQTGQPDAVASQGASSTDTIAQDIVTVADSSVVFTGINHNVDFGSEFTFSGSQVERADIDGTAHRFAAATLDTTTAGTYNVGATSAASATSMAMSVASISPAAVVAPTSEFFSVL